MRTSTRSSSPSRRTATRGRVGGVEQGRGDLVGRGGDGGEDREPHGRLGGRGERVGDLAGAFVAERGGGGELGLDLGDVR